MRKREKQEMESVCRRMDLQQELSNEFKAANKAREEKARLAELAAEGYRPYTLYAKYEWGSKGFLIGYQYSKDGRWLDIQEKGKLITVPTDNIVRFAVTDGVMIDR